jgi:hypothetical protein
MRPRLSRKGGSLLAGLLLVPLIWSLSGALAAAWDAPAWSALWADPQTWSALGMSLWTGVASTLLAMALSHLFVRPVQQLIERRRIDAQDRLIHRDHAFVRHIDRDLQRCLRGPLPAARDELGTGRCRLRRAPSTRR